MITNQDRKQIKLMKQLLDGYLKNNIQLSELLMKLDQLARLTTPKAPWKEAFFSNWLNLESLDTESTSIKRDMLSSDELKTRDLSLKKITQLVDNLLSSYESISDVSVDNMAREIDSEWLLCPLCNDAWNSNSKKAMVICPRCDEGLHNPRYIEDRARKVP